MELTREIARSFAKEKFSKLDELGRLWNFHHSRAMIRAIRDIHGEDEKLEALAWVHDLGKIIDDKTHAEKSLDVLKDFELSDEDIDCIKEHGSSGKPKTEKGEIMRFADGLSLFYPEAIAMRTFMETRQGNSFGEIRENYLKRYDKYMEAYKGNEKIQKLLTEKFNAFY